MYQVPQGSEMRFSCPEPLYQTQSLKPYLRKRERQAVDGPLGDLKEHYIFLLLNVPLPPKQGFHVAPKKAIDLDIHIDQALLFILFYHFLI